MGDDENIHSYMAKVNDPVLGIRCVGGTIEEDEIVSKMLSSLPPYKHKVIAIYEIQSVTTVTRDILVRKIVAFEPSEFGESHGKFEATFRASASLSGKQKYDLDE